MQMLTVLALGAILFTLAPGAFNVVMIMAGAIVVFMLWTWVEESAAERKPPTDEGE